jgi:hypothetical protein
LAGSIEEYGLEPNIDTVVVIGVIPWRTIHHSLEVIFSFPKFICLTPVVVFYANPTWIANNFQWINIALKCICHVDTIRSSCGVSIRPPIGIEVQPCIGSCLARTVLNYQVIITPFYKVIAFQVLQTPIAIASFLAVRKSAVWAHSSLALAASHFERVDYGYSFRDQWLFVKETIWFICIPHCFFTSEVSIFVADHLALSCCVIRQ